MSSDLPFAASRPDRHPGVASQEPPATAPAAGDGPLVSIVIPVFNKWAYTAKCLEMLARNTTGHPYEVIVVDNASSDETRQGLAAWPAVRVQRNETNLGFAKACNQGARMARGRYILFLNNDTEPLAGWLEPLVRIVEEEPDVAIVGSKLLFPDGTLQHAGVHIASAAPLPVSPQHIDYRQPADRSTRRLDLEAVTGACFIIRGDVFFAAGGFDEGYVNGCEDIDLCFKVREAGGRVVYTPQSVLVHHESVSDGRFLYVSENMVRFHERWMHRYPGFAQPEGEQPGAARNPGSPSATVVLVAGDALSNIAPCLESLARCAGRQDEILIVDDASGDGTHRFVESFRHRLPGAVRVIRNPRAEGFARCVNAALEQASHPYVLLLRPEAVLTPGCLDRMVDHLERRPAVAAVGPQCDRVEGPQKAALSQAEMGFDRGEAVAASLARRFAGRARPTRLLEDFCLLARRSALAEVGGLDPDLWMGSHDLDLCQRLTEAGHALSIAEDAFVRHFGQLRLRDRNVVRREYLRRQSANLLFEKLYRRFQGRVPASRDIWGADTFQPQTGLVSIVLPVHDRPEEARRCLESVYRHTHRAFELILVDNGARESLHDLAEELRSAHGDVTLIRDAADPGYGLGTNRALAAARGEFVVLLRPEMVVTAGWLSRQLALMSIDPRLGIVGPRAGDTVAPQHVERVSYDDLAGLDGFAARWFREHPGEFSVLQRVAGLCMVMRRDVLQAVGGMDPAFGERSFADDDFCLRAQRAGFKLALAADVFVHHAGGAAAAEREPLLRQSRLAFRGKWEIPAGQGDGYAARDLVEARPFDVARDHVPLDPGAVYTPGAAPLDIGETRAVRLLCVPDWQGGEWKRAFVDYLRTFGAADPVSLVLRVEPPLPEVVEAAFAAAQGALAEAGVAESAMPDVVFEASVLAPARRGGLYTAASALLAVQGSRSELYAREARACGLPVVEPVTPERLREVVAELLAAEAPVVAAAG